MAKIAPLSRAGIAGVVIAAGIGLGAFNPWWVATFIGVPLILTGLLIAPRASRISELGVFRAGTADHFTTARIEALTRSSLADEDLQPTLVTATISPADDTSYRARWLTTMSRRDFQTLTDHPRTVLPPDSLPSREATRTPEFDDQPGRWAVLYPAITIVAALAVLLGVGDRWHVSLALPSVPAAHRVPSPAPAATSADLDARRDNMIRAVTDRLGPGAAENLLDLRLTGDGSDYATVFDPTNGEATNIYISAGRDVYTSATPSMLRRTSTFTSADVASIELTTIADRMTQQFRSAGDEYRLETLQIRRSGPGLPVLLTGSFNGPRTFPFSKTIDARPDGTVAELFDPADFAESFTQARQALELAGIAPSDRVLTALQIRGTARNTPHLHASSIQNSGGVLVEFRSERRSGDAVVVPGQFPEIRDRSYRSSAPGFSLDDAALPVFESVRRQAMQRGSLEPYESGAVDIEMSDRSTDKMGLAIRIQLAGVDAAAGTYSTSGEFLKQGSR
ncbi:hypothetical protein [Mycolicibacter minnesotensis]